MSGTADSEVMGKLIDIATSQAVIKEQLNRVEAQAIKTNGRVNSIEEWKTGLQAVAQFQKDHPQQAQQTISAPNAKTVVVQPQKWFQSEKLVGGVVVLLTALAALLIYFTNGGGMTP